jgi:hypothetical protein
MIPNGKKSQHSREKGKHAVYIVQKMEGAFKRM